VHGRGRGSKLFSRRVAATCARWTVEGGRRTSAHTSVSKLLLVKRLSRVPHQEDAQVLTQRGQLDQLGRRALTLRARKSTSRSEPSVMAPRSSLSCRPCRRGTPCAHTEYGLLMAHMLHMLNFVVDVVRRYRLEADHALSGSSPRAGWSAMTTGNGGHRAAELSRNNTSRPSMPGIMRSGDGLDRAAPRPPGVAPQYHVVATTLPLFAFAALFNSTTSARRTRGGSSSTTTIRQADRGCSPKGFSVSLCNRAMKLRPSTLIRKQRVSQ